MNQIQGPIPDEQIAELAKQFWLEEGEPEGKAEEHWLRAEAQLQRQLMEALAGATASPIEPQVQGIS